MESMNFSSLLLTLTSQVFDLFSLKYSNVYLFSFKLADRPDCTLCLSSNKLILREDLGEVDIETKF